MTVDQFMGIWFSMSGRLVLGLVTAEKLLLALGESRRAVSGAFPSQPNDVLVQCYRFHVIFHINTLLGLKSMQCVAKPSIIT
jgi:hypothetical protein